MKTILIETKPSGQYFWRCYATIPVVGRVVIATDRTPERAQYQAAKFLDVNYPGYTQQWAEPYRGGDTSKKSIVVPSDYWGE